ncbi:hypothetical protein PYCCODRAFT_1429178 [Trametes coccinea BRFM310]|uniref:Uncharacterized protein n=1 Tax=Trametes coccinea (strain BRFM310) TaxID=1353009 RepID=A0A1Y2I5A0_TRAC3|nr:hypothetical protein PYCCODRAFT_1429178 [Trametes coccinea BRFM310]
MTNTTQPLHSTIDAYVAEPSASPRTHCQPVSRRGVNVVCSEHVTAIFWSMVRIHSGSMTTRDAAINEGGRPVRERPNLSLMKMTVGRRLSYQRVMIVHNAEETRATVLEQLMVPSSICLSKRKLHHRAHEPNPEPTTTITPLLTLAFSPLTLHRQTPHMPLNIAFILQRPPAIVGTLRSDAATFGATIDFSAFIEALKDIGFRIGDHKSTTNVVALWGPPELLEAAHTIGIARPSSATEWPAADQALIAEELKQKFGLMPADFIQFNGVLAYGSAIFIESDD